MPADYGMWVNVLSHKLKKRMNAALSEFGITAVQSRIMRYIMDKEAQGPVFQRDVEKTFEMSRSTATAILQLLEKNGVIRRESVPKDARLKSLVPTEKAQQIDERVRACMAENQRLMIEGLSEGQLLLFLEVVKHMSENLDCVGSTENKC